MSGAGKDRSVYIRHIHDCIGWNIVEQYLPQLEKQINDVAAAEGIDLNAPDTPPPA